MPISYQIDPVSRRVVNTATGVLRGREILETQRQLAADPAFQPTLSQLFDLTSVSEVEISTDEIHEMAAATAFRQGARRALIAGKPLLYGLSRMFQTLLGERGGEVRIFTNRGEAEKWLEMASS